MHDSDEMTFFDDVSDDFDDYDEGLELLGNTRYQISSYNVDTVAVYDTTSDESYMIYTVRAHSDINKSNSQLLIATTLDSSPDGRFVVFGEEVYSLSWFALDARIVQSFVYSILKGLDSHVELSNPIELAAEFGGYVRHEAFALPEANPNIYQ